MNGWGDVNQFGCYQTLGRLVVNFGSAVPETKVSSPSGHAEGDGKPIANSVDGDSGTKWCVDKAGTAVVWQIELVEEKTVSTYALTSADDVPTRDPQVWVLDGSTDGKTWTELDRRSPGKPFENRFQTKTFDIAQPAAFRFYRFTFTPQENVFPGGGDRAGRSQRDSGCGGAFRLSPRSQSHDRCGHDSVHA